MLPGCIHEAEVDRLLVAQRRKLAPEHERAALAFRPQQRRHRSERRRIGQLAVTDDARHFFDQVLLMCQIETIGRGTNTELPLGLHHFQAQAFKHLHALRLRDGHANHFCGTRNAQAHGSALGHTQLLVIHGAANRVWSAANIENELGDAFNVLHRLLRVHPALEAMAGFGGKTKPARAPRHSLRPPERGLNVDILRSIRYRRGLAAHDAGQGLHLRVVCNHAHLGVQRHRAAIEQIQRFAHTCPANVQPAVNLVQVKDMRGPAQLEHHVV